MLRTNRPTAVARPCMTWRALTAAIEDVRGEARRGLRRDLPPPGIDSGQRWVSIRVVTKA